MVILFIFLRLVWGSAWGEVKGRAAEELLEEWTDDDESGGKKTDNLIKLYVFADKYDVPRLKLDTLLELFMHITTDDVGLPSSSQCRYAFENLPEGSPLLHFLLDAHCFYASDKYWHLQEAEDFPPAFINGILIRYTAYASGDRTRSVGFDICDYHDHKEYKDRNRCEWAAGVCY